MTIKLDMRRSAKVACEHLGSRVAATVLFLQGQMDPVTGGFYDRDVKADLYYTVFGIESLWALGAPLPLGPIEGYLRGFDDGHSEDLVHLACLARCWSNLPATFLDPSVRAGILNGIERYQCRDGGYSPDPNTRYGTIYGALLALGAYQDLGAILPDIPGLVESLESLRMDNGGYANSQADSYATTITTAAAVTVLTQLRAHVDRLAAEWLLKQYKNDGGFVATEQANHPDLISTATALHGLSQMKTAIKKAKLRRACLDFIDSLLATNGGFYLNHEDDNVDCESVFYGLLAMGHLHDPYTILAQH